MRVYLKKPQGRRKSFALYTREGKKNTTIANADLDALNGSNLPPDIKLKNALAIKKQVEVKLGIEREIIHNEDNERILSQYWNAKYERRELVDAYTAKCELERSVRAIGKLSLVSATEEEIEKALKAHEWSKTKRRRVLGKIQLITRYLGRDLTFNKPPKEKTPVTYLSEDAFLVNLSKVEDPYLNALYYVLFYTGMRLGEAFGLTSFKVRDGYIMVDTQVDTENKTREPKWNKTRKAFVQAKAFPRVKEWLRLKSHFPHTRNLAYKQFKKAFGNDFTLHDLRHSYAIWLLSKGVPIAHVAQSLGNSVRVCEEYYTGFELVDESISLIKRLVNT